MAFNRVGYGQVELNQVSAQKTGQIFASLPLDDRTIAKGADADTKVDVLQNGEFMYYDYASGYVTSVDSTADPSASPAVAGVQEPYLVYNEYKIYEDWLSYKDFAMIRVGDNYVTNPAAVGRVTSEPIVPFDPANPTTTGIAADPYQGGSRTEGVDAYTKYPNATTGPNELTGHVEYGYRMNGIAPRLFKTNIGDIWTTNMVETGANITYAVGDILKLKPTSRNTLELSQTGTIDTVQVIVAKVYTMPDGQQAVKVQRIK